MDFFTREIISDVLVDLGDQMFDALARTSLIPISNEAKDFAVGVTDAKGNLLAQGNGFAALLATLDSTVPSPDVLANGGSFFPLEVICPKGSLLNARAPVSVYFRTFVAAMDVMWKALAPILPDRLPAGHMPNVGATLINGTHVDTDAFIILGEPLVDGWSAVQ